MPSLFWTGELSSERPIIGVRGSKGRNKRDKRVRSEARQKNGCANPNNRDLQTCENSHR